MELNYKVANHLIQKYGLRLIAENEENLLFDFNGTEIEYNKKIFYLTKSTHRVRISKISSLEDVDNFMRLIIDEKQNTFRN